MRNTERLKAIALWIVLWAGAATNSAVSAEPPVVLGNTHHETLAEGLPKNRTDVGIGEDVRFWVDSFGEGIAAADLKGEICWSLAQTNGFDTVYPILGESTTLTVGLSDVDTQLKVQAVYWVPHKEPKAKGPLPKLDTEVPPAVVTPLWESALQTELGNLNRLRAGGIPNLDQLERRGGELLAKHFAPREQSLIHFQLAHIHAQSGLRHPATVIKHARAALKLPLDSSRRSRLQVYWGDALRVLDPRHPFADRRRAAATVYLQALNEVLQHNLPARPPKFPIMILFSIDGEEEENKRRMEEQWKVRRQLQFQVDMIKHRDVLRRQITSLYQRKPFNRKELEQLAGRILKDPAEAKRLSKSSE